MSHYRQVLQSLRCDVGLIRDHCFDSRSQSLTARMLATIDRELASVPAAIPDPAMAAIPSAALLLELGRRIREVRHIARICSRCGVRRHRARGLCHKCYKIALKRGEIKAGR